MPMIPVETTIGATTTNNNLLSGSAFEFARGRGVFSCGVTAAATGVIANISAGADIIAEAFMVPILSLYPRVPDEMYFTDVVESGDRLVIRAQNTTGAGIVVRAMVQLSYGG